MGVTRIRTVRTVLAVCLLSGVAWLGPSPARAQYGSPLCTDAADVLAYLSNWEFGGYPTCEVLCKRIYADCKEFLARSRSCELASIKDRIVYQKKSICDPYEDPAQRKACRQSFDETGATWRADVDTEYQVARDNCAVVRNDCATQCD